MLIDLSRIQTNNKKALDALVEARTQIKIVISKQTDAEVLSTLEDRKSQIDAEILLRKLRDADITAARVTIQPMSDAQLTRMAELAEILDGEIVKDAQLKATMGFVRTVLSAATELGQLADTAAPSEPATT